MIEIRKIFVVFFAGDQITSMTVSFKQMVLEDAITLLSYASPYEVNLDMQRVGEKQLGSKGIYLSPAVSGLKTALPSERVCHPFFKSQSIDDLRKVCMGIYIVGRESFHDSIWIPFLVS